MKQGSTVTYLHGDHLGSTSVATNSDGAKTSRQTYYAFGAVRTTEGTLPTDYTFTGQKNDSYIKLIQMGVRWYDGDLGRFTQPDSIIPDLYNPQDLNRYSYVRNNPLRYTDPSGYDPLDEEWENDFRRNNGVDPTDEDRRDRLFSLMIKGHGEDGAWTADDWANYYQNKDALWRGEQEWDGEPSKGLDRFINHIMKLASYYKIDEKKQFVSAVGLVWASIPTGSKWNAVEVARNSAAVNLVTPFLVEGDAGWLPDLLDCCDRPDNPSHHFAAHFFTGFYFGSIASDAGALIRDFDNMPDVGLGFLGGRMGGAFALRRDDWRVSIGSFFKNNLGMNPAWR
jgi:RHS repeat-associated protein